MSEVDQNYENIVAAYRDDLKLSTPDKELIIAINEAVSKSKTLKEIMDSISKENKFFWKFGTDIDQSRWHPSRSKVVNNRIFTDIETAIPIITAEIPEATVILGKNENNKIKEDIKKGLRYAYEVKFNFQKTLQKLVRSWYIQQVGILKYGWDEDSGFFIENKLSRNIGFDATATSLDDAEYVWEIIEIKMQGLIDKYKDKAEIIKEEAHTKDTNTKVRYMEFWGGNGEWRVVKFGDAILKKTKNPNFDYGDKEVKAVEADEKAGVKAVEGVESKDGDNILEKPEFPYILLNVYNLEDNKSVYDDTGVIQQTKSLQEDANKGKQQISDLNEGQKRVWVVSGIASKIAQKIVDATGDLMVILKNGKVKEQVGQVQSGKPDAAMFNNVDDSLKQIDNTIGMHNTTRGERGEKETLGGRKLLRGADMGRLDLIVRNVEQVIEKWWTVYLHMIKVYADEDGEVLRSEDDEIELKPENIPADIKLLVKKGSTLPTDEASRFEMAKELAGANMIDPMTLFEEMG